MPGLLQEHASHAAPCGSESHRTVGMRYGGSSITNGVVSPRKTVSRSSLAQITASTIPIR